MTLALLLFPPTSLHYGQSTDHWNFLKLLLGHGTWSIFVNAPCIPKDLVFPVGFKALYFD